MNPHYQIQTVKGYLLHEVISAFQKCIRRCWTDQAMYWATELSLSNYDEYLWKRMKIIMSEDIGLAEPTLPAQINALYVMWTEQRKKKDEKHAPERLYLIHAVLLLATCKKSRMVDNALTYHFRRHSQINYDIPDVARDKHTIAGRKLKRGFDHFFAEGVKLENQVWINDDDRKYAELAPEACKAVAEVKETLFDE